METENKQLKRENETLKREIAELTETNKKLKQSLDEATRLTRPQPPPRRLKPSNTRSQASSEIADSSTVSELKHENETLKREIAELRETNNKLKESLHEAVRSTKPEPARRGTKPSNTRSRASLEAANSDTDGELQRQLLKQQQQMTEMRQQLLNVQDRLTVTEQVTAATQRRELVQEGVYENLPSTSVYEKLRFDPTQEHVYAKLQLTITHKG